MSEPAAEKKKPGPKPLEAWAVRANAAYRAWSQTFRPRPRGDQVCLLITGMGDHYCGCETCPAGCPRSRDDDGTSGNERERVPAAWSADPAVWKLAEVFTAGVGCDGRATLRLPVSTRADVAGAGGGVVKDTTVAPNHQAPALLDAVPPLSPAPSTTPAAVAPPPHDPHRITSPATPIENMRAAGPPEPPAIAPGFSITDADPRRIMPENIPGAAMLPGEGVVQGGQQQQEHGPRPGARPDADAGVESLPPTATGHVWKPRPHPNETIADCSHCDHKAILLGTKWTVATRYVEGADRGKVATGGSH